MGTKWSREIITKEIQRLHKTGVALNSGSVRKTHSSLIGTANHHFGSWKKAIEAADLDYAEISIKIFNAPRRAWSKAMVAREIQKLNKAGVELSARYATLNQSRLYGAACHHFGSWKLALEGAGLDETKIRLRPEMKKWSKKLVIAGIKSRQEAKLALNSFAVEQTDWNLCHAGRRHFGSWDKALDAAGFDSKSIYCQRLKPWTKPEFFKEMKTLQDQAISLSMANMIRIGRQDLIGAGHTLYSNWKQAIETLGLNYDDIKETKDWSPDEIIQLIQHLASEGHQLSHGWVSENHKDLNHAAYRYFGGWSQALTASGLNYREHAKYWSTKAWLNAMDPDDIKALSQPSKGQKN